MSEKAQWQKRLLTELEELLAPHGFVFVPSRRSYRKPTSVGWQSVHLAIVQHPSDFDVVVDVGVRFDRIQQKLDDGSDKRGHRATIGCEYGNLIGTGQHRWSVEAASDVSPAAHGILKACEATLFPFLEAYSDLATVYEALRRNDAHARLIMPLEDVRKDIVGVAELLLKEQATS